MKKRVLSLFLCAAMLISLLALPACSGTTNDHDQDLGEPLADIQDEATPLKETPQAEPQSYTPNDGHAHVWGSETITNENGYHCHFGKGWVAYHVCTLCGAKEYIAFRPEQAGWSKGIAEHDWVETEVDSGCKNNPTEERYCKACGETETIKKGGHDWGSWNLEGDPCTGKEVRTCNYCGEKEERATSGHKWQVVSTSDATCTEQAKTVKKCSVCNEEQITYTGSALAHTYRDEWISDNGGHSKECVNCGRTTWFGAHTPDKDGKCTVCGFQVSTPAPTTPAKPNPATCEHTFGYWEATNSGSISQHSRTCTKCGYEERENCRDHAKARTSCTDNLQCSVCGTILETGAKSHLRDWDITSTTHQRKCQRTDCQYAEAAESHTFSNGKCTVCGYVNPEYHVHTYGPWTASADGHTRSCTVPGCSATESSKHNLGAANCQGEAVCKDCGATVNTGNAGSTHVGGTEIRDAKAAEVGVAGYTGDTYCLGCGKKISSGSTIPALPASHTHSFASAWQSDSTNHWHACSCGERQDVAAHTFKDGKCTVCGAVDPNYRAPETHTHSFSSAWTSDANQHWHACSCGEKADVAAHTFKDGKCTVCGTTDPNYRAPEGEHTHSFSSAWSSNSSQHWHACSCGEKADVAAHTFKDGKCTVCGAADPSQHAPEQEHTHSFSSTWTSNSSQHWHVCSCGEKADVAAHTFGTWSSSNETIHTRVCSVCGQKETAPHTFVDGKCTVCGISAAHEHSYGAWTSDGVKTHSRTCTDPHCGDKETAAHTFANGKCTACGASVHTHTFGAWVSDGADTHSRTCTDSDCAEQQTAAHTFVDGKCSVCGEAEETVNLDYIIDFDHMELNNGKATINVDVYMNGTFLMSLPVTIDLG